MFIYKNNWQVILQKYDQKQKIFVVNKWNEHFHVKVKSCAVELAKAAKLN